MTPHQSRVVPGETLADPPQFEHGEEIRGQRLVREHPQKAAQIARRPIRGSSAAHVRTAAFQGLFQIEIDGAELVEAGLQTDQQRVKREVVLPAGEPADLHGQIDGVSVRAYQRAGRTAGCCRNLGQRPQHQGEPGAGL